MKKSLMANDEKTVVLSSYVGMSVIQNTLSLFAYLLAGIKLFVNIVVK